MRTKLPSWRTKRLVVEVVRFMAVGGLATLISFVGFNVLVHGALVGTAPLAEQPVTGFIVVNVVAGIVAYVGIRVWAFSHREVHSSTLSLVTFFGLGALTMAIPVACLAVSRYGLGLTDPWSDNISANVIGLTLGTTARFWVFRRYVFLDPGRPKMHPDAS